METINNLTTAVSTAIWGDQDPTKEGDKPTTSHTEDSTTTAAKNQTPGVEPVNGQLGNVAAGEPYDKGNVEPVSTADKALPSTAAHTTPAAALPDDITSTNGSAAANGKPLTSTEKTYLTYENLTSNPKPTSSPTTATGMETKDIPSIPTHPISANDESSTSTSNQETKTPALTGRPIDSSTSKTGIEEVGMGLPETTTSLPKTVDDKSRATGVIGQGEKDQKNKAKEEQIFPEKKVGQGKKETKAELGEGDGKSDSLDNSVKKEDSHGSGEGEKEKKSLKEKIKDKLHVHKH